MRRFALRFATYQVVCWSLLLALAWGEPAAAGVVLGIALYTTLPLVAFIARRGWPFYPVRAFRLLVVRVVLYGQLLLPVLATAAAIGLLLGAPFGRAVDVGRVVAAVVLVIAGVVLLAGYVGSRALVVREIEAHLPGLPPSFDGMRIAQISDLHVGPHTSVRFLRRVLDAVAATRPDLIAVTGDLIDDRPEDVASYAAAFATLDAPLGVFIIPGNHDVYAGWEAVERALRERTSATILVNEAHVIDRDGERLAIVGLGDPAGRGRGRWAPGTTRAAPDPGRAFAAVPATVPTIAFAHNPALWPSLAERGAALTLSGHTHWGQLAVPRLGWSLASAFLEHAMGAYRDDAALLYISPGTGYWGIPFRLGAPPEVTAVTVRHAPRAALTIGIARCAA